MAIDPDVDDELKLIRVRLDALEAAAPPPKPPAPPPASFDLSGVVPRVTLPQGAVAPMSVVGIDAEAAGASMWNGSRYVVGRDWDEAFEGRHLIFSKGQIDWAGHTLIGVHQILHRSIGALGIKSANIGGGIGRRVMVTNPDAVVVSDVFNHGVFDIQGATLLDAIGDTWRPLAGSTLTDAYIRIGAAAGTSAGKHYDGAQFHNPRNAPTGGMRARQTLRRIVFAGVPKAADGTPLGAVNSMIFFQSDNLDGSVIEDILVVDASGVWFPIRLGGTGTPSTVRRLQLAGTQGPPQGKPAKLAPAAFVLAAPQVVIDPAMVFVDVPGVLPLRVR